MNLRSCCHKCKEQVFHYRGKENETMLPFYKQHYSCMQEDPDNIETKEDQMQEEDWMRDNGGYKEVTWKYHQDM